MYDLDVFLCTCVYLPQWQEANVSEVWKLKSLLDLVS